MADAKAEAALGSPRLSKAIVSQIPRQQWYGIAMAIAFLGISVALTWVACFSRSPTSSTSAAQQAAHDISSAQPPQPNAPQMLPEREYVAAWHRGMLAQQALQCGAAEKYFGMALEHLDSAQKVFSSAAEQGPTVGSNHQSEQLIAKLAQEHWHHEGLVADRLAIQGERGFALVCMQRYVEGAALLERALTRIEVAKRPAHLLNALGLAHLSLRSYRTAVEVLQVVVSVDASNPIAWNNLAAARLSAGDIGAADDALYYAMDRVQARPQSEEQQRLWQMMQANARNLAARAKGQITQTPSVELFPPGNVDNLYRRLTRHSPAQRAP